MTNHRTRTRPSIAIFGLHTWGEHIIRICHTLGLTITGLDPDLRVQRYIAKTYPFVTIRSDADMIFHDPAITACIITSPSSTHYTLAKEAILAGKHVLVEKPMTQNTKEAQALVALAAQRHRRLMADHTYLFSPALKKARNIIRSGGIGSLLYIRSERSGPGPIRPDSTVIWDLAPHDISVSWLLTGQYPTGARILGVTPSFFGGPYDADIELGFSSGVIFHGHISWIMPQKTRNITIVGTKASLTIEWKDSKEALLYQNVAPRKSTSMYYTPMKPISVKQDKEPLLLTVGYFLSSLTTPKTPLTDGTHAYEVIRIIEKLNASRNKMVNNK